MSYKKVNVEDLTLKELNDLHPTYGVFEGVNFERVDYYRLADGTLMEVSWCWDESLSKRVEQLEHQEKKLELMKQLGFY